MRISLFEFEDLKWFPDMIRSGGTDYLRYLLNFLDFYHPAILVIQASMKAARDNIILDLCSGGGGPIESVQKELNDVKIFLSDLYPNTRSFEYLKIKSDGRIDYIKSPVNAIECDIKGFRTLFSAIHHFQPTDVVKVLQNAVDNNAGIAIFDGGNKSFFAILGQLLFHPVAFFFATPFFRPFRFSRIFFTYFIPFIPFYTIWDGVVSFLRLYTSEELLQFANKTNSKNYHWQSGNLKNRMGLKVTYLVGYPEKEFKSFK